MLRVAIVPVREARPSLAGPWEDYTSDVHAPDFYFAGVDDHKRPHTFHRTALLWSNRSEVWGRNVVDLA